MFRLFTVFSLSQLLFSFLFEGDASMSPKSKHKTLMYAMFESSSLGSLCR